MKNKLFFILTVLLTIFAFALNTFAQDHTHWGLPEGAKARLGKGHNREIAYSQTALNWQLRIALVFGYMMHKQVKNWTNILDIQDLSQA